MKQFAYVGCRTTKERNARGKGIRIFEIENGTWKPVGLLEGPVNPSYFCLNEAQDMLYTIHGDYSEVSAYRIQPDGKLVYCNTCGVFPVQPQPQSGHIPRLSHRADILPEARRSRPDASRNASYH